MEPANPVFGGDRPLAPGLDVARPGHEFERLAAVVGERNDRLVEALERFPAVDAVRIETVEPVVDRLGRGDEGRRARLTAADPALRPVTEREERQGGPRRPDLVAVVEVVRVLVVEVHRPLHEAQAEHVGVELDVRLRVARNRRYVA